MDEIDQFLKRHIGPDVRELFAALRQGRDWRAGREETLAAERLTVLAEQIAAAREAGRMARARAAKADGRVVNPAIQRHADMLWNRKPALRNSPHRTAHLIAASVNVEVGPPTLSILAIAKRLSRMKN